MFDVIPPALETMNPGPVLACVLASIDVDRVSGYDRVVVLKARQRMVSHYQAQLCADMASLVDVMDYDDPMVAAEAAAAEIRVALRLTRRAADSDLSFSIDLCRRLPVLWEALAAGRIDIRRAWVIASGTVHLDEDTARQVVEQIIPHAPRWTTGQLAAHLAKMCIAADPAGAEKRYEDTVADRRVVLESNVTGTANLCGWDLPPDRAAAVARGINRIARSLRTPADPRTMDELRADVFLDLLSGHTVRGTGDRAVVDIRVDLATLTRLSDEPGEVSGYGPVIADIARQVTRSQRDAQWRWTVTHPDTGRPVATGTTRRRPTADQKRTVHASNPTCVFPGCRMPATECDLDHRIPWAQGGPTTPDNLPPLCRHDHDTNRHRLGWTYRPLPNGDYRWQSPLGHTYTTSGHPP